MNVEFFAEGIFNYLEEDTSVVYRGLHRSEMAISVLVFVLAMLVGAMRAVFIQAVMS